MVEPVFIKCETGWSSDNEESSKCNSKMKSPSNDVVEIRVEPDPIFYESRSEEEEEEEEEDKNATTDVKKELSQGEHGTREAPQNESLEDMEVPYIKNEPERLEDHSPSSLARVKNVGTARQKQLKQVVEINVEPDLLFPDADVAEIEKEEHTLENEVENEMDDEDCDPDEAPPKEISSSSHHKDEVGSEGEETNNGSEQGTSSRVDGRSYSCDICWEKFDVESLLKEHATLHVLWTEQGKQFVCVICNGRFKRRHHLRRHVRLHTGLRPYICTFCGAGYSRQVDLDGHMLSHKGKKPYNCVICTSKYSSISSLNRHLSICKGYTAVGDSRPIRERRHACDVCNKMFYRLEHVRAHMSIHTGDWPYACSACGKGFRATIHLEEHMRLHTGEKPHSCTSCGKCFTHKSALSRHLEIHSEQRQVYQCHLCEKTYLKPVNLRVHLATHGSLSDLPS